MIYYLLLIIILTGCRYREAPLTNEQVFGYLNERVINDETLVVYYNPALCYTIQASNELIEILGIEDWVVCKEEEKPKNEFALMVYFDLMHYNSSDYSRVVVFQNGYAVIQINRNGEFEEKVWYKCNLEGDFFESLFNYISAHSI